MSIPLRLRTILLTAAVGLLPAAFALAQPTDAPGPVGGAPATLPELKLPDAANLGLSVPRQVRAAQAVLGMGRQRLALVLGIGNVGTRRVVDSAQRDTQAVATALREGGFVVMLREDLTSAELRAVLQEFRERLQPGGVGFAYVTGLAVQVAGQTVLLTRDVPLDAAMPVAQLAPRLRAAGVPMSEVVDALTGTADSPRLLVVDAAYRHPALEGMPVVGLAEPRLPPGLMALYGLPPGNAQEVPAVAPLPVPPPTDAREIAASPFARVLVGSLLKPRINGPEVLRSTRRAIVDATLGITSPWIGGDTDGREELAEASLLDGLVPRTPEEMAREGLRQASRLVRRGGAGAGEQSVAEVLQQSAAPPADSASRLPSDASRALPQTPGGPGTLASTASNVASAAGTTTQALGAAAGVASTVASVAGTAATVATVAVAAQAATASTAAAVATTAVGTAGSVVGNAVALGSRLLTSSGEGSAAAGAAAPAQGVAGRLSATAAADGTARLSADSGAARQALQSANAAQGSAAPTAQLAQAAQGAQVGAQAGAQVGAQTGAQAAQLAQVGQALQAAQGAQAVQALQAAQMLQSVPTAQATLGAPAAGAAGAEQPVLAAAQAPAAAARPGAAAQAPAQAPGNTPSASRTGPQTPDGRTARSTEGGERPVYMPRMNAYGYAEGDTYTYRLLDTWKGEVVSEYTTAIEEVLDTGEMLANGQRLAMDAQGRVTRQTAADGSYSEFVPRQELWWSRPQRGQSRDIQFQENFKRPDGVRGQTEWKGSTDVGSPEKVATPAGEFEVLPMESSGWWTETLANGTRVQGRWSRTVYYSPKLGHPVAIDIKDTDALGRLLKRERIELLRAQSQRGAP